MGIPLVDLSIQHRQIAAEIQPALDQVMTAGAFVGGPDVTAFEQEFASYCGVAHCVGVANGTEAIELALRAGGVGRGDAVALPANTFVATAEAVVRAGATPVLVDCDPDHLLIDPERLDEVAGSTRLAAVIPVHLYGQLAPMAEIVKIARQHHALVVEDAAQSQGASQRGTSMGGWGDVAATSFYPGKNLGAYGDGGAVLSNDADLAGRVRLLANHGSALRYQHDVVGLNSRLDTMQAVVLRAKLRRLEQWNEQRRAAAAYYDELLVGVDAVQTPSVAPGNVPVWHLYVVRVPARDHVLAELQAAGIGAAIHYPVPVHLTPAFRCLGHQPGDFPVAEAAAAEILSLPLYPGITAAQQERVAAALVKALR
jgi:dTDP-4-amino-4,6-dideoxygalactose transaminase